MSRNPCPIVNISRKSTEARTKQLLAMRESPEPKVIRGDRDKANQQSRSKAPIAARIRKEGEATGPTDDLFSREAYVPGMGDHNTQPYRRGMDDHTQYQSLGDQT